MAFERVGWSLAGAVAASAAFLLGGVQTPEKNNCVTYKVAEKPVTAYVLKPPPPVVVHEKCPAPAVQTESQKLSDAKPETNEPEEKPRHKRRRWRRY